MSLTERSIQRRLFFERRSATSILLPNYTPKEWWECDVWAVTKAGFANEYEIKLTVSDFRADAGNETVAYQNSGDGGWTHEVKNKHTRLAMGDPKGPVRFWYCVPRGLLDGLSLPPWAGLMEFDTDKWGTVRVVSRKDGQKLHREAVAPEVIEHAKKVCYWRYWNARNDHDDYVRDMKDMRKFETEQAGGQR